MAGVIRELKKGADVGRVVVEVQIENVDDVRRSARGEIAPEEIRSVALPALVDSGATLLCLPRAVIDQLGLPFNQIRPTQTAAGPRPMKVYGGARIHVLGRSCEGEVMGLEKSRQALLGQVPLELMDFWVDPVNQRLVGNPEHGGQWMAEAY